MEENTETLNFKKEELLEARKNADFRNEELKKELATKEEIASKRL